jgi:hypothetical protein
MPRLTPNDIIRPIDISGHSIKLSRRQVRAVLKQVAVYCCGVGGAVRVKRSLMILEKCVSEEGGAPELAALLEFARLKGEGIGSRDNGELLEGIREPSVERPRAASDEGWDAL